MENSKDSQWSELVKTGLGMVLLTKDRLMDEVDRVLQRKEISASDREDIQERLLERTDQEREQLMDKLFELLDKRLEQAGVVRKEEFDQLRERVEQLEEENE